MIILLSDVISVTFLMLCLVVLDWLIYTYIINRGAVYYPTTEKAANRILDLSKLKKGQVMIDLGSGDGIMLIEAAKRGIRAIGYEIDPVLVWKTKKRAEELKLLDLIEVRRENMYEADFNEGDVLYFYQFPKYLVKFGKILDERLDRKKLVISNRYQFPKREEKWVKGRVFGYYFGE